MCILHALQIPFGGAYMRALYTHIESEAMRAPVLILMGSVRPNRRAPHIADWVRLIGQTSTTLDFELVDLVDWPLPMDDEPEIPAGGKPYNNPLTHAWSEKIATAPAVVFVSPQYNWGYPAPLKNALDHLYREWRGKPAMIISYGGHGGGKCAAQLRQVLDGLKMRTVPTMPALTLRDDIVHGAPLDPALQFAGHADTVAAAFGELAAALDG